MRGLIISGTHSGCGKTTVTLGILSALKRLGMRVQSFKAGPDFIDSGLHGLITGKRARNLDLWMCGERYVKSLYKRLSEDADISIIEGVMGLYDGEPSTGDLARVLNLPVILTVDCYGVAESIGAIIKGFMEYSRDINIVGVILNRVSSINHLRRLKDSIRGIPVLGHIPYDTTIEIPRRHLGLLIREEEPLSSEGIKRLADLFLNNIDIEKLCESASEDNNNLEDDIFTPKLATTFKKIGIASDSAFNFYYDDNLEFFTQNRASIIPFSPLRDTSIPSDVDFIYLGGGYPEEYGEILSENRSMIKDIKEWVNSMMPLYAECGGLIYLCEGIEYEGRFIPMAGVIPLKIRMEKKRPVLGYRKVRLLRDSFLGTKDTIIRGHEFHYSKISGKSPLNQISCSFLVHDRNGEPLSMEGYSINNTIATYIHLHLGSLRKEKIWKE